MRLDLILDEDNAPEEISARGHPFFDSETGNESLADAYFKKWNFTWVYPNVLGHNQGEIRRARVNLAQFFTEYGTVGRALPNVRPEYREHIQDLLAEAVKVQSLSRPSSE